MEARVPILRDVPGAKALVIDGGYRYSDYSLGFSTNTYKIGLQWAPISDVRFRASYQSAVRAPNIQELYSTNYVALDGGGDPCTGAAPTATLVQCERSGVTAAEYGHIAANPASQYNGRLGGNPNLSPETAKTTSFGIVLTPTAVRGFAATVDYFKIRVANLIGPYGADFSLNQCVTNDISKYCALIHRGPNGTLWLSPNGYVTDTNVNTGGEETSGVDANLRYALDMGAFGKLSTDLTGTYVRNFVNSPAGGAPYDCANLFGPTCGPPLPRWRHNLTLDWDTPVPGLSAALEWRYVSSTKVEYGDAALSANGSLAGLADAELPSFSYIDLSGAFAVDHWTFRLGVNNLFDKDPPLVGAGEIGNGIFGENNTYPQIYDTLGRYIHFSVSAKF
jgi:iron complex outermembrane recepter protein